MAEPTLAVTLGRPFAYDAGGDLHTSNSGDGPWIGTHVQGTIKKHTGDLFLVELKLVVGNGLIDAGNPETELVKSQTLDLRTIMSSGEKKQFNCGRSRVLKIHLQPMPAAKVESQVRQANTASSQSGLSRKPLDVGNPVNVPDVAYGKTESGRSSKSDNDDTQTASAKTFGTPE